VVVVVAWAQLLSRHVQSVQVKVAHHLVSRTPLMYLAESTLVRQCGSLVGELLALVAAMPETYMCMLQLLSTRDLLGKKMTLYMCFR
jgi:hypothetical protein